ncbi:MAG: DNA polymerase III subunit delta [Rubrivivax sp.]|nr:DNA polymerase III subunit delta [Rubrivivax sp.]
MQLRPEQLSTHLAKGVRPLYVLHGDEPLLMQEAADAIRAAARAAGCEEREVFPVSGAHFDWSGVLGAAQEMSLFASGKILEIRIPSGKPGKDGGEALQRLAERPQEGVVTLVLLPRLDGSSLKSGWFSALDAGGVSLRIDGVSRAALPAWIAARLALQQQHVEEGPAGEQALAFFADRVEGNLLAAHQEVQKLALLHPPGVLAGQDIESAILDVARYDIRQLCAAVLDGQVARALRMLDGLRAEGETAVGVHWQLANDLRDLARVRAALDDGRPMPLALSEARLFGPRQALVERAVPRFSASALSRLLSAAAVCDGVAKGLAREDWPQDAWAAVRRLVLMTLHFSRARGERASGGRRAAALVLPASLP